ncbi:MAG TPA: glycogen/starch synthase, partial [Bacillota bacterium]|nr:glycogen/starch synthase [Bacillota bacterium]
MKILMLSWEFPPKIVGGIARHVHDLSLALVKQGHHVHVIT